MFRKVLVANRGEIAVRAFRAAHELGAGTAAVFPLEDRDSVHRLEADESPEIDDVEPPARLLVGATSSACSPAMRRGVGPERAAVPTEHNQPSPHPEPASHPARTT